MAFKIGIVTHYYEKLGMAIVTLDNMLAVGDKIRIDYQGQSGNEQTVKLIQIEDTQVQAANSGQIVSIKLEGQIPIGSQIYKI